MFGKARSRIIIVDQKNLEMEKVAVLVVEAEITRDDNNHTLLPVLKDVAHLCKVLHHPPIHPHEHSPPPQGQHSGQGGQAGPPPGEVLVRRGESNLVAELSFCFLSFLGLLIETTREQPGEETELLLPELTKLLYPSNTL